ncbi:Rv1733c family protein [Streptomyces sp. 7N604]|uniref:Rv1733c family protein n=1 Tax=Streptomyces sp. 7N604 TaxID=3457415 RepID=UPI003FD1CB54
MRAMTGLWRWRRNPLRRRTDLVESWVALLAALFIAAGAPAAGVTVGSLAQDALAQSVRKQHEQRHPVPATVVRLMQQPHVDPDPETSSARDSGRRVVANWTAPDGTVNTGPADAPRTAAPGDRFRVWTDDHGRLVPRPMDGTTATSHAMLAGAGAGAVAAGLVEAARRLAVWRMLRRRYEDWDRAWERAGQDWGRTGAGS